MYVHCIEMCIYCTYSTYILCTSVCPLLVQSYTTYYEAVNHLTPRIHTILNGHFVLVLRLVSQERNPGVKQDLPVCVIVVRVTQERVLNGTVQTSEVRRLFILP